MSKFKDIDQLTPEDIASFFEDDTEVTYDFVQAASRTRLPRAFISRHTYVAAVTKSRLVMWAKRGTVVKTLADISCSIDIDELSIDDTWSKRNKKGCELFFPDGQRVIIESMDAENSFVETLTEHIASAHSTQASYNYDAENKEVLKDSKEVFAEPGVALADSTNATATISGAKPAGGASKTPVVTREVIIESLKRANEGAISPTAIKQWAVKVRDCKILDADEAMIGYILFSLSRIDDTDTQAAQEAFEEYYERLTVTLV